MSSDPGDASVVEAVPHSQKGSHRDKLSIILDAADLYHQFCICYKTLYDTCNITSDMMRIISIIHVDKDTMEILDIYASDPDDPSQDEIPDTP